MKWYIYLFSCYVLFQEHFQKPPGAPKPDSKWTNSPAGPMQCTLVSLFSVFDIAEPLATELDSSEEDSKLKQMKEEQLALEKGTAVKEVALFQSYAKF